MLRIHSTNAFSRYPKASCLSKKGFHHRRLYSKAYKLNFNGISKITWANQDSFSVAQKTFTYSPSYNLTPPISRVLIGQHYIFFCSLTAPAGCNSPLKCAPVKCQKRQEAGFPIVTETTSITNSSFILVIHSNSLLKTYTVLSEQ